MAHRLHKNGWDCKPNPNSLPHSSRWLLSLASLNDFSRWPSFLMWLLIFWWLLYSGIIISNMYIHFHHCFFIAPSQFFVRLKCLLTLRLEIRHRVECFMKIKLRTLRCFWFQSNFSVIASLLVTWSNCYVVTGFRAIGFNLLICFFG